MFLFTSSSFNPYLPTRIYQKELIYNTAKEILLSENVDKFSIRMISRECNIGMGTIYKYYGNKDDILIDITQELWMSFLKEITNKEFKGKTFIERIDFYFFMLKKYSKTFNYTILSKKLSTSFKIAGKSHHQKAQKHFVKVIINDLNLYFSINTEEAKVISDFICNNLISLITMTGYSYDTFRIILEKIIKPLKEKTL